MSSEPVLRLHKCLVRPYEERDVESLTRAANNSKIACRMLNTFPQPYSPEDAKSWISNANSASPLHNFAICEPGGSPVIGAIGLKPRDDVQHRTMEIGFWLGEEHWGQGIASEAIAEFSNWAFDRFERLLRLEAIVFDGNVASGRALEKADYEFEGRQRKAVEKEGVILDTLTYCKFREGC